MRLYNYFKISAASVLTLGLLNQGFGENPLSQIIRDHATNSLKMASSTALQFQKELASKLLELQSQNRNGLIEIDMGETASLYKHDMIYSSGVTSSGYRQASYASSDNKSYQMALANALTVALRSSGLAVLSVGFKQEDSGGASGNGSGLFQTMHSYNGKINAFVFVGTTENSIAEAAAINNHLMNLSEGLNTMNQYYKSALNTLTEKHKKKLLQDGYKENSTEFLQELNKLIAASQIKYSFTMINDSEDYKRFQKSLEDFNNGVDEKRKEMQDKYHDHKMSDIGGGRMIGTKTIGTSAMGDYVNSLLNDLKTEAKGNGHWQSGRLGCYSITGTTGSQSQCITTTNYDACVATSGCSWGYIAH